MKTRTLVLISTIVILGIGNVYSYSKALALKDTIASFEALSSGAQTNSPSIHDRVAENALLQKNGSATASSHSAGPTPGSTGCASEVAQSSKLSSDELIPNEVGIENVSTPSDIDAEQIDEREREFAALEYLRTQGFIIDETSPLSHEEQNGILENLIYSFGNNDVESISEAIDHVLSLETQQDDTGDYYFDENLVEYLQGAALNGTTSGTAKVMQSVYELGGHPKKINQLIELSDNEDPATSKFATLTLFELLNSQQHSVRTEEQHSSLISEQDLINARAKLGERIAENPSLIFAID